MEAELKNLRENFNRWKDVDAERRSKILFQFASWIQERKDFLLEANRLDRERNRSKISSALFSRLELNEKKISQICLSVEQMAGSPDPVGSLLEKRQCAPGLILSKIRTPIGLIAIVFESRPDVVPQILSLMIRSANVVLMKGGSEAQESNRAFFQFIQELEGREPEIPRFASLLETREDFRKLLKYDQWIDLVVPRGSNALVRSVMEATKIPVLGHADGVCHIYVDQEARLSMAQEICVDAKTQSPSACNAMETLLIDAAWSKDHKRELLSALRSKGCELRCDQALHEIFSESTLAQESDFGVEFSDLILSAKEVQGVEGAIQHIERYSSRHTEAIVSESKATQEVFCRRVDSASVMVNASTRFADGYRYGLGAELGISTSRLHARGPVGVEGLCSYRYLLHGQGDVVSDYEPGSRKKFQFKEME